MNLPYDNPQFDSNPLEPTFYEKMSDIGSSAKIEFQDSGVNGKSILLLLGAMTAYEWGPGNETLTPYIGAQAVEVSDGLKGVLVTAAITGGFTVAQQLASSWLTRKSVQMFPEVV